MKVTLTYKKSKQIAEDEWVCFTKVIHVLPENTLREVYNRILEEMNIKKGDVNLEIQFVF